MSQITCKKLQCFFHLGLKTIYKATCKTPSENPCKL